MTRTSHTSTLFSRLRQRLRASLVMEATPEQEAFDRALRQTEKRVPPGLSLLALLAVSVGFWVAVVCFIRGAL